MPRLTRPRPLVRGWPLALALIAVLATACGSLTPPPPATEQAQEVSALYILIFGIAIVIFVGVEGLLVWSVVRYRRRDDRLPSQFHGNTMLEVIWTAIPTVIVIVIFILSLGALATVEERSDELGATIEVEGFQWQWAFTYAGDEADPDDDFTVTGTPADPPVMGVPVGERVRLILTSPDVIHAFFVPQFLIKRDVNPYPDDIEPNTLEFTVTEAGEYTGQCAEFCGTGHAAMGFIVRAMPRGEFDAWIASGGEAVATPAASPADTPTATPESPAASPAASPEASPVGALTLSAENNEFSTEELAAPADQPFTLTFENRDEGVPHNVSIYSDGTEEFTGDIFPGVETRDYDIPALPAGEYEFVCDVHPDDMVGTLTVD